MPIYLKNISVDFYPIWFESTQLWAFLKLSGHPNNKKNKNNSKMSSDMQW